MDAIVIDASVALAWYLNEEHAAAVKAVFNRSRLIAPWLWRIEVANVVLVRTRRKMLTEAQAAEILRLLDDLPVEFIPEPVTRTATELATRLLHEAHVVTVPGEAFGTGEHIRISYPVTKQNIDEGTRRMGEFLSRLA